MHVTQSQLNINAKKVLNFFRPRKNVVALAAA